MWFASITNRIEPHHMLNLNIILNIFISSKRVARTVLACCFYGSMWQIALENEISGAFWTHRPAENDTHIHTHTTCHDLPSRSSFTSLAAFSPSSRRFLSIIFDLSAAALSSALTVQPMIEPCARQTSENGSDQLGPFRSRTVNYKDAAWIDRCDIKVQSVTI